MVDSCGEVKNIIVELMILKVRFEFQFMLIDNLGKFINFNRLEVVINEFDINYFVRVGRLL